MLEGHLVQMLEIQCPNGYVGCIYVTREPAFTIKGINTWHYDLSDDGTKITLKGIGTNSVNFGPAGGPDVNVTDWPVEL